MAKIKLKEISTRAPKELNKEETKEVEMKKPAIKEETVTYTLDSLTMIGFAAYDSDRRAHRG